MHGPHCKLGWFIIWQHQKHSSVLICYLFIFNIVIQDSGHHTVPSRCTATTTTPPSWMATMHRPLQNHHTQAPCAFPSSFHSSHCWLSRTATTHTSYQCYLRQHVYCSLTSLGHHGDHIFVAGPTRLYSHLAHLTLHTDR